MSDPARWRRENRSLTGKLWLFVAGSFAFGFALVPLYRVLCQVTGFGDQKLLSEAVPAAQMTKICRMMSNSSGSASARPKAL